MVIKQRWPQLRYVARTQKIDLDWLFERLTTDPGLFIRYILTKEQLADIFTKGSFTAQAWFDLLRLSLMLPPENRKYVEELKMLK